MTHSDFPITSVLSIGAHPDDLDVWAFATEAEYAAAGAQIHRLILTAGGLGSNDPSTNPEHIAAARKHEEQSAAQASHVAGVSFADFLDCELTDSTPVRETIVRHIRQLRPQVVICWHPEDWHHGNLGLNHPDHRAAGAATLAAVFPLARNRHSFPEHARAGLQPHSVATVLMISPVNHNYAVNVADYQSAKQVAIKAHGTQTGLVEYAELRQKELGPVETFMRINQPF